MNFKKLGRIFKVDAQYEWMNSHTTPIAAIYLGDIIRVYFSTRSKKDGQNNFISNSSFIDVNSQNPLEVLYIHDKPLFNLGGFGFFDEFGVMVTDVIKADNKIFLYYAGWQRLGGGTAAYQVMLGLGISEDGGISFQKYSDGPVMSIDVIDPVSIGNVAVLKDIDRWRLYYTSLSEWVITGNKPTYEYVIKYAEGNDGIFWNKTGKIVVDKQNGFGVATPSVAKIGNEYHMWFGYRKGYDADMNVGGYSIGYAYSQNGVDWIRDDSKIIFSGLSEKWDSEMMCYPSLVQTENKTYLFYCGNNFGEDGFGVAELIHE